MFMKIIASALWVAIFSAALPPAVMAQSPNPNPPGQPATGVEDSAILPDAGRGGPSAAPTMNRDCQKDPAGCNDSSKPSQSSAEDAGKPGHRVK
jgi:hypothetical protein